MADVLFSKDIKNIIDNSDFSILGENVAIKVHFGERGCTTFMNPEIVKSVCDKITSLGKKVTLIECNVLYKGSRTNASDHIATAKEHGFDFAPIDILDGEQGDEFIEVPVKEGGAVEFAKIGAGLKKYDSLVSIAHFKGHVAAGYGAQFKTLGMGLGSRAGKLHMHANVGPFVTESACIGCEACVKACDFNAIDMVEEKAIINQDKCVGCAMCVAVCPTGAVAVPWGSNSSDELQKRIVDYTEAVLSIIPKDKSYFINIIEDITKDCDCVGSVQTPVMADIGITASTDIVALDYASMKLVLEAPDAKGFEDINDVDKSVQVDYAEKRGLGKKDYTLKEV